MALRYNKPSKYGWGYMIQEYWMQPRSQGANAVPMVYIGHMTRPWRYRYQVPCIYGMQPGPKGRQIQRCAHAWLQVLRAYATPRPPGSPIGIKAFKSLEHRQLVKGIGLRITGMLCLGRPCTRGVCAMVLMMAAWEFAAMLHGQAAVVVLGGYF